MFLITSGRNTMNGSCQLLSGSRDIFRGGSYLFCCVFIFCFIISIYSFAKQTCEVCKYSFNVYSTLYFNIDLHTRAFINK